MTLTYSDIKEEIAYLIGTPQNSWDAVTAQAVDQAIRKGIDSVVHNGLHQWSWMRPRWAMSTAPDQRRYPLPRDFEQFVSDLYFDGVNYQYQPITQLPASRLLQLAAITTTTGTPTRYAIESEAHDGATPQGSLLVLDPTPDANYQLFGYYMIGVRPLSDLNPYPPGGDAHGQLFLAAILATIESKFLDSMQAKQVEYQDMLQVHIQIDLRRQPRNLGKIGDNSGRMPGRSSLRKFLDLTGQTTIGGSTDF